MLIRKASAEEMMKLWGYQNVNKTSPTAKYLYHNISSENAILGTLDNEEELIGELYVFFNIEKDRDFAAGISTAYLCPFRVKKEYRGHGLGSRMMETVLDYLKVRGFRRATIGVNEERNEKLYRRMGFTMKIKDYYFNPCAIDENMQPKLNEEGYLLLSKEL